MAPQDVQLDERTLASLSRAMSVVVERARRLDSDNRDTIGGEPTSDVETIRIPAEDAHVLELLSTLVPATPVALGVVAKVNGGGEKAGAIENGADEKDGVDEKKGAGEKDGAGEKNGAGDKIATTEPDATLESTDETTPSPLATPTPTPRGKKARNRRAKKAAAKAQAERNAASGDNAPGFTPINTPSAGKPAVETTSASKPAAETTSASKPAVETTSASKPAVETTSASKPAVETTSASKPAVETTSASKPAATPAGPFDRLEQLEAELGRLGRLLPPSTDAPPVDYQKRRAQEILTATKAAAWACETVEVVGDTLAAHRRSLLVSPGTLLYPLVADFPILLLISDKLAAMPVFARAARAPAPRQVGIVSKTTRSQRFMRPVKGREGYQTAQGAAPADDKAVAAKGKRGDVGKQAGRGNLVLDLCPPDTLADISSWLAGGPTALGVSPAEMREVADVEGGKYRDWISDNPIRVVLHAIADWARSQGTNILVASPSIAQWMARLSNCTERFNAAGFSNDDLARAHAILFPWHYGGHWTLFILDCRHACILQCEPVEGRVHDQSGAGMIKEYALTGWGRGALDDIPQTRRQTMAQLDADSCGASLCYNAALFAAGATGPQRAISEADNRQMRLWMLRVLYEGRVTDPMMACLTSQVAEA